MQDYQGSDGESFAVTVTWHDGRWVVSEYDDDFTDPSVAVSAVRGLRSEGAAFALLCVDDDYFVIVRPTPRGVRYLLSDAYAAVEDDFAAAVLEELDVDVPDIDDDELADIDPSAEGDFDLLADLGVSEQALIVIADDADAWASEQLMRIAEEMGFDDELADTAGLGGE